jgi:hypothetical protein
MGTVRVRPHGCGDSLQRPSRPYQSSTLRQKTGVSAADAASKASRLILCFANSSGVTSIRPLSSLAFIASMVISIALDSSSDRPSMGCVSCAVSNRRRRLSSRLVTADSPSGPDALQDDPGARPGRGSQGSWPRRRPRARSRPPRSEPALPPRPLWQWRLTPRPSR